MNRLLSDTTTVLAVLNLICIGLELAPAGFVGASFLLLQTLELDLGSLLTMCCNNTVCRDFVRIYKHMTP